MANIFCFANQKGGVGKTTSCVNLAASLIAKQKTVLLIDLDPQGNATTGSGHDKTELLQSAKELLLHEAKVPEIVSATPGGYDLIPANQTLTIAEMELLEHADREFYLRKSLANVQDAYDFILLDCPPSLNMLTINALTAATGVIIPVQCEYYALEGLAGLLNTIQHIQTQVNPALRIVGILRTLFDSRTALSEQVSKQLLAYFPQQILDTIIPRNIRLAEAPSYGIPGLLYDAHAAGVKAYLNLAEEIIAKHTGLE